MRPVRLIVSMPATTAWLPLDTNLPTFNVGIFVTTSGVVSGTASVEVTGDDVFNSALTPVAFAADTAGLANATGAAKGVQTTPVRAARLNGSTSATGSWILTINQAGDM